MSSRICLRKHCGVIRKGSARGAVLVDGGEKQLDLVLDFIDQYRPDVSLIPDFIHVLEYPWKAAYGFHTVGSIEAENRVAQQALKILRGRPPMWPTDCA
jgi:hypothetical protein